MGARKIEKFPVQIMNPDAIKVDHDLQSRVATSTAYQREFSEAMLRGDSFPPITLFFDGKHYWLADGFHRLGAFRAALRQNPKLGGIKAEIREGSRRDAMIFSAGTNQRFSIPRTIEDIKKAIRMLLVDPEWFSKADSVIAKHVGTKSPTVKGHRAYFCAETNTPIPDVVTRENGREKPYSRDSPPLVKKDGRGHYWGNVGGKRRHLGGSILNDHHDAVEKVNKLRTSHSRRRELSSRAIEILLLGSKITWEAFRFVAPGSDFHGYVLPAFSCVFTWSALATSEEYFSAIGKLVLMRSSRPETLRSVVCSYMDMECPGLVSLARKLGIEFMTPDEIVDSFKPDQGSEAGPSPG